MLPQKHFINKSVTDMKYTNPDHLIQLIQSLTKAEKDTSVYMPICKVVKRTIFSCST